MDIEGMAGFGCEPTDMDMELTKSVSWRSELILAACEESPLACCSLQPEDLWFQPEELADSKTEARMERLRSKGFVPTVAPAPALHGGIGFPSGDQGPQHTPWVGGAAP